MNRHEATIFRGGAIIRTVCALIALSEGPCGKLVGCSAAAANNRGTPCADYIGYPSTETIAGHFSENDHRQFRLIRSDHSRQSAFGLISPSLLVNVHLPCWEILFPAPEMDKPHWLFERAFHRR